MTAGNGLTDLVKRPTGAASALCPEEMATGAAALHAKIKMWRPGLILFAYRPPADYLLGRARVAAGRCDDLDGVPTFLLSGPYASAELTSRVNDELKALLLSFRHNRTEGTAGASR